MKRIRLMFLSIVSVVLVAGLISGATFALFTAQTGNQSNTFTAGTLSLSSVTPQGQVFTAGMPVDGLAPGDKGTGILTVKNEGSLDAWVNIVTPLTGTGDLFGGSTPLVVTEANGTKLIPAGQSRTFVLNWELPLAAGDSYQGKEGVITINVNGVQAKHNPAGGVFAFPENGGTMDLANGRLEFATPTSGAKARAGLNGFAGLKLADITALSYKTYVVSNTNGQAPSLQLRVDRTGDGVADDTLVFEPIYQSGYGNPYPAQGPVALGTWQTWDAMAGGWWDYPSRAFGQEGTGAKTLAQYVALYPNATVVFGSPGYEGIGLKAGSGWTGFVGYADDLLIGVSGVNTMHNFN